MSHTPNYYKISHIQYIKLLSKAHKRYATQEACKLHYLSMSTHGLPLTCS